MPLVLFAALASRGLRPHGRSGLKYHIASDICSRGVGLRPHGRSGLKFDLLLTMFANVIVSAHTGGVD